MCCTRWWELAGKVTCGNVVPSMDTLLKNFGGDSERLTVECSTEVLGGQASTSVFGSHGFVLMIFSFKALRVVSFTAPCLYTLPLLVMATVPVPCERDDGPVCS